MKSQGFPPYFAVIDEAKLVDDYIYQSPVVAIASRYPPIKATSPVQANAELATAMGGYAMTFNLVGNHFAQQLIFLISGCVIAMLYISNPNVQQIQQLMKQTRTQILMPKIASSKPLRQRSQVAGHHQYSGGSEAALLLTAIIERRAQSGNPILLMGDFNDNLQDGVLQHLLTQTVRNRSQGGINQLLAPLPT